MSLRPELVAALREGLRLRLTLVCAPAGYGKTCLVSHVLEQHRLRHAWYRLDSLDQDPAVFLEGAVAAWRRLYPGFGARLLRELQARPGERPDDLQLAALFIRECEAAGPEACRVVLVLDEYEHVAESAAFNEVLGYLLENAPAALSVVVATRYEPAFPCQKLEAAGQVKRLDTDDLRFSAAQTIEVLAYHAGRQVPRQVAQAVHTTAQGWPTGVVMAAGAIRRASEETAGDDPLRDPRLAQNLYSYLAEQVYLRTSPETREFLLKTCCLTILTPDIASAVATGADAYGHIRELVEQRAFTFETPDGRGARYHPLFRDFLQTRLVREHGSGGLRQAQHVTAKVLEDFEEHARAVDLLLDANDPGEALAVAGRAGERVLDDTQADTLRTWLQRIPATLGQTHPWALIVAAHVGIRAGEFDDAFANLERAVAALRGARDGHGLYQALSVRECALFWQGEGEAAVEACREALDHALTDAQRVHSLLSLACAAVDMRRWEQAEEALASARSAGAPVSPLEGERSKAIQGHMLYFQGKYRDAQALFSRLDMSKLSALLRIGVLNSKGLVETGLAKYTSAINSFYRALRNTEDAGHELARFMIIDNIAVLEYIGGNHESAIIKLKSLAESSEYVRENSLLSFVLCHLGTCFRRTGLLEDARAAYGDAAALVDRERDSYMRINCEINLAFTDFLRNGTCPASLESTALEARQRTLVFVEGKAMLLAAIIAALEDRPVDARRLLRSCLPLQLRNGHYSLLLQEFDYHPVVRDLAFEALEGSWASNELKQCLTDAAVQRQSLKEDFRIRAASLQEPVEAPGPRANPDGDARATTDASAPRHPALTPRENEILGLMAQGLSNEELGQRLFLAPSTVKTHVNRIFRKLGVTSRVNAVLEYQRLTRPPAPDGR